MAVAAVRCCVVFLSERGRRASRVEIVWLGETVEPWELQLAGTYVGSAVRLMPAQSRLLSRCKSRERKDAIAGQVQLGVV